MYRRAQALYELNTQKVDPNTFIGVFHLLDSIRKIVYRILWNKQKNELLFFWLKIRNQIPGRIMTFKRRLTVNGRKGAVPEQGSRENCSRVKFLFLETVELRGWTEEHEIWSPLHPNTLHCAQIFLCPGFQFELITQIILLYRPF